MIQMDIEQSQVTKLVLSNLERLDPITVFLEDLAPRKGKITIECFGKSWSSYWGGMGERSIAEFFVSCDNHYLAKNLSSIPSDIDDYEEFVNVLKKAVLKERRAGDLDQDKARDYFDEIESAESNLNDDDGLAWCKMNYDLLLEILGEDWWYEIPKKANSDYKYLCNIIDVVREGLSQMTKPKVA
ncbi:hypothetical protein [Photobacterium damselae]|uniref:hypothetical protein n=1 Tax=Photobacterium damselae TaxID=38293 RepID=UPI0010FF18A3|nr:hypothetical protein [Photobacterium damselae]TLS65138.1 hypothetical protein FD718_21190 [Photobacterium damselae subsp. damselae]